jgi:hypothetical protein
VVGSDRSDEIVDDAVGSMIGRHLSPTTRTAPRSGPVSAELSRSVELDQQPIRVMHLQARAEMAVDDLTVGDAKTVEVRRPRLEIANCQCDDGESLECFGAIRREVEADDYTTGMSHHDPGHRVFVFSDDDRPESQGVGVPLPAGHHVRHRHPDMVEADDGGDGPYLGQLRSGRDVASDHTPTVRAESPLRTRAASLLRPVMRRTSLHRKCERPEHLPAAATAVAPR